MRFLLLFFLIISTMTCTQQVRHENVQTEAPILDKRDIRTIISSGKKHLVVYGSENEYSYSLETVANDLTKGGVFRNVESIASDSVSQDDFANNLVELIGSPEANKWVGDVLDALEIRLENDGLFLEDRFIAGDKMLILLNWYPNPINPQLPIKMITGQSDDEIKLHFQNVFAAGSSGRMGVHDLEIYQNGQRIAFASFDTNWQIDKSSLHVIDIQETVNGSVHLLNYAGETSFSLEGRFRKWQTIVDSIELFFNQKLTEGVEVQFYPTPEKKALLTQFMDETHRKHGELHSIHSEVYSEWIPTLWIEELLEINGLISNSLLLRPTAVFLNKHWNGIDLTNVNPHFIDDFDIEWIFRNRNANESEYLKDILAANYIKQAVIQDKSKYIEMLKSQEIDFAWFKSLNFNRNDKVNSPAVLSPFLKGFNFAHEGYAIHDGYGSKKATIALDSMFACGSNAMAINPYSYMKNSRSTGSIPVVNGPNMENDESIIHSARHAQNIGMKVVLKPHIWLTGSWPGAIGFSSDKEWSLWLKEYKRWILHFALLAEILEVDIFCIGTELKIVSLEKPEFWRELIVDIRSVYNGNLTYAANWGEEFENLSFWEDLDFIGCDAYYPLSKTQEPSKTELENGVSDMFSKLETVSRANNDQPVILTEIGYPNLMRPWINPHSEKGDTDPNFVQQAKCVKAISDYLQKKDPEYIKGIFWWKWPSYLRYKDRRNVSFTLYDTPSEEIVKDLFTQMSD